MTAPTRENTRSAPLAGGGADLLFEFLRRHVRGQARTPFGRFAAALFECTLRSEPSTSDNFRVAGCSIFPCRPPFAVERSEGGRSRSRHRTISRARELTNWLFTLFSYWDVGSPTSRARIVQVTAAVGAAALTPVQARLAEQLCEDLLPFCRPRPPTAAARGIKSLAQHLEAIRSSMYDNSHSSVGNDWSDPAALATNALPVVLDRLAIPEAAATCHPEDWLSGQHLE